jgi:hypothetical protein
MKTQLAQIGIKLGQNASRATTAQSGSFSGLKGDHFLSSRPSNLPAHNESDNANMLNRPESMYKMPSIRHKQSSSARTHPYKHIHQKAGSDDTNLMPPPPRRHIQNHIPSGNGSHISNKEPPVTPVDQAFRQSLDAFRYSSPSFSQQSVQPISLSQQNAADTNPMSEHNFQMSGALHHQNQHDQPAYGSYQNPDNLMPTRQGYSTQPAKIETAHIRHPETQHSRIPSSRHPQGERLVYGDRRRPCNHLMQSTPIRPDGQHEDIEDQLSGFPSRHAYQQLPIKQNQSPVFIRHAYVEDEPFQLVPSIHGRHTRSNTLNSLSFIKEPYTARDTQSGYNHLEHLHVQHPSTQRPITQQFYDTSSQVSKLTPHRPAHLIENKNNSSLQPINHGAILPPRSFSRLDHIRSAATYHFPGPAAKMIPHERPGAVSKGPLRVGARSSREVHSSLGLRRRVVR